MVLGSCTRVRSLLMKEQLAVIDKCRLELRQECDADRSDLWLDRNGLAFLFELPSSNRKSR